MSNFGKTYGELMLEAAIREAYWRVIRRRLYLGLATIAAFALCWLAFK